MKSFSYLCLLLLCSASMQAMLKPSQATLRSKRSKLTQQIRFINVQLTSLEPNSCQCRPLHEQLLHLLKEKKETYVTPNSDAYKTCVNEINRIEKILDENPNDLTVSTIATKDLELAKLEAAKLKALADEKEKQALEKLEHIIVNKINNLSLFKEFDLEQLVIQQENPTANKWQKERFLKIFEIKSLWLENEDKTIELLKTIKNKIKELITSIYDQHYTNNYSDSWLTSPNKDHTINLQYWQELRGTFDKLIKNITKLPLKKITCNDNLATLKKERITLLKGIINLQKQISADFNNLEVKNMLASKLKEIILNIHDEWAHTESQNKSLNSLYWVKKYLSIWNQLQDDQKEKENNSSRCIIL